MCFVMAAVVDIIQSTNICRVPYTILNVGNTAVNKIDKIVDLMEFTF